MNILNSLAAVALLSLPTLAQPTDPKSTSIYDSLTFKKEQPVKQPETPSRITVGEGKSKRVIALGRRFAVVMGVAKVEVPGFKADPLPECDTDAALVAGKLTELGYKVTLLDEDGTAQVPTKANVIKAIHQAAVAAGENDQILVYCSTHGGVVDNTPVLLAKDQLLPLREIKKELAASKALVRVIMLDACRDQHGFPTETSEFRDIHTVLSCRPDETSLTVGGKCSVFTAVLIDALSNCAADRVKDGQLELDEVLYYLDEHVPILADRVEPGHAQNPTRSVVDPRAVNPIIGSCSKLDMLHLDLPEDISAVGVEGVVGRAPRNDLVIAASAVGKLAIGMTPAQMEEAMGKAESPVELDKDGADIVIYKDKPEAGDTTFVFFGKGTLSHVFVMYGKTCDGEFSAPTSRSAFIKLLDGKQLAALTDILKGQTTKDVFAKLGCPVSALSSTANDGIEVYSYPDVPVQGQELIIRCHKGVVEETHVNTMKPAK